MPFAVDHAIRDLADSRQDGVTLALVRLFYAERCAPGGRPDRRRQVSGSRCDRPKAFQKLSGELRTAPVADRPRSPACSTSRARQSACAAAAPEGSAMQMAVQACGARTRVRPNRPEEWRAPVRRWLTHQRGLSKENAAGRLRHAKLLAFQPAPNHKHTTSLRPTHPSHRTSEKGTRAGRTRSWLARLSFRPREYLGPVAPRASAAVTTSPRTAACRAGPPRRPSRSPPSSGHRSSSNQQRPP